MAQAILERAVPAAVVDVDGADFDAVLACVADDLRGRIEAHRLGVEQGRAERVGMMAFHPARRVGDQCEARCVALGKAVATETLDLLEGLLGEVGRVAASDHAADQLVAEMADAAGELERRHRPAEQVRLGGGEPGAFDRDAHRLLLEKRHAERLLEHAAQFLLGIGDRLLAFAPAQIGMDHVALDRAGAHDRDLDHQVVEGPGLDPGQHAICARLSIWKTPSVSALRIIA
jgi:hypothetical protein